MGVCSCGWAKRVELEGRHPTKRLMKTRGRRWRRWTLPSGRVTCTGHASTFFRRQQRFRKAMQQWVWPIHPETGRNGTKERTESRHTPWFRQVLTVKGKGFAVPVCIEAVSTLPTPGDRCPAPSLRGTAQSCEAFTTCVICVQSAFCRVRACVCVFSLLCVCVCVCLCVCRCSRETSLQSTMHAQLCAVQ